MALLHDDVLDNGLQVLTDDGDELHICSQEPTDYTGASSTHTLGNAAASVGAPGDATPDGRKVTVAAITGGSVTASGTATHWALVDTVGSRLLATEEISPSQAVTSGGGFDLEAFDIRTPDPA